jgi:RNA polymerase sigma-70 factor, ECF subfamily
MLRLKGRKRAVIHFIFAILVDSVQSATARRLPWRDRGDAEVVTAVLNGDQDAFNWLVRRYWKSMYRVVWGIVRDEMAAQEVVQDTWMTIHRELKNFRLESSLKNWMFKILTHRAFRVLKKEARSVAFSQLASREENEGMPPEEQFTEKGRWKKPVTGFVNVDPQAHVIHRQGLELLGQFIEALPAIQRAVVTMRDIEGLSSDEVSDLLDITPANQRVLLHRARTTLRQRLLARESEGI